MNLDPHRYHVEQVHIWIKQAGNGLPSEKLAQLFSLAIQRLWQRSQSTLSETTLIPIFERALLNSQEKFPLLLGLKFDLSGPCFVEALTKPSNYTTAELTEAFQYFLVNVIAIIGSLTDNILTKPLYKALFQVTLAKILPDSENQLVSGFAEINHPDREKP